MFKTIIDKVLGKTIGKIVDPGRHQADDMFEQIVDDFYRENYPGFVDALAYNLEQRTRLSRNEIIKICQNSFTQKFIDTYEYTIFHSSVHIGWEIRYGNNRKEMEEISGFIDNTTKQLINEAMSIYKSEAIVEAYALTNLFVCDAGKKFGSTKIPEYFVVK